MARSPMVNLRAAGGLDAELAARGDSMNEIALRDLRRYYAALATALEEAQLTEPEWNFLRYLWAELNDADEALAEKWGVNRGALALRIRALPAFTRLAIVDAVDRWWRAQR